MVAGAAHGMLALDGDAFLARDEAFDVLRQLVGAAAQALQLALDQLGVLVGCAEDFLRDALGCALREAQQLDEIIGRAERTAAGFWMHSDELNPRR